MVEKTYLYPKMRYAQQSIKTTLQYINRPGFTDLLFKEHKRLPGSEMFDIKDREIWSSFKDNHGYLFSSNKHNIARMINVDWFQPFKN